MNPPFRKGQTIELGITDLAEGTRCFGKLPEGLAVFVDGPAAVGDRVAASITKIKKNYLESKLVSVLGPSDRRVDPPCPHFGTCGGCKWQHIAYEEQLRIKGKLVEDALRHLGGFADAAVPLPIAAPHPYEYRNKVEFSFGDRRYLLPAEMDAPRQPVDFALGFHVAGHFEKVLDIGHCDIATDLMNRALTAAKRFATERKLTGYSPKSHEGYLRNLVLRQSHHTGELLAYIITSAWNESLMTEFAEALAGIASTVVNGVTQRLNSVAVAEELHTISGRGSIEERLGPFSFVISPNSFFQTNSVQALKLYEATLAMADLKSGDEALDLYCGTGTISLFLSRHAARVHGFEQEASSIRDANENALRNGVSNCTFTQVDLRHFAQVVPGRADVVITDPPRAGMHADAVQELRSLKPRRIVYVSCNPASLARDGKMLCADGLYRLSATQPVDLFPQTYHVETVARFDLSPALT